MKAQIYCHAQRGLTLTFDIGEKDAVIGRESSAGVPVPVEGVSRRHASISWDGKAHWVQDLKSTNGTFLNGEVLRRQRLRHLDVITLGKAVNLIYVIRGEEYEGVQRQGIVAARLLSAADQAPFALPLGETTLGRSPACNIVIDSGTVSKIHARIERSTDRLVVEDLGSSNGTLVNGVRSRTAVLRHGDELSLAGVESWSVEVELGEIKAPSRASAAPRAEAADEEEEGPDYSPEWKTRFEWSEDELADLRALQQQLAVESASRRERAAGGSAATSKQKPGAAAAAKPKPAPQAPPKVTTSKPAAAKPPAPAAAPAARPAAPAPKPAAAAAPATPARPAPPAAARPATPAPAPPVARRPPAPAPADDPAVDQPTVLEASPVGRIVEVRLVTSSFELAAKEPGDYSIGRSSEATLRVVHPTVSRKHARLILSDDRQQVFVQHDGGANGTRLDGREIERIEPVKDGSMLEVGDVQLRVVIKRL